MSTLPATIAIIDSDNTMRDLVKKSLYAMGIGLVKAFSEGNQALQSMKVQKDVGLIFLDWKLKDSKSIAIFQAIRSLPNNVYIPIIVTSGLIEKEDFSVLNEFPCVELLEKPYTKASLEKTLRKVWDESLWYQENEKKVSRIFSDLATSGPDKAKVYLELVSSCQKPQPLILAASRFLRESGQIDGAAKLLINGLNRFKNDPSLMGELGKIHFINGDLLSAKQCVEKSISVSPDNIERLIFAGEVSLNLEDNEKALGYFDSALAIDKESEEAKIGKNLVGVLSEDKLKLSMGKDSAPRNLAGMLNLLGITQVRSTEFDEGLKQYNLALGLVREKEDKQKIWFNLSLGYLRAGYFDEAENALQKVIELGGKLAQKAIFHSSKMDKYRTSKPGTAQPSNDEVFDDFLDEDFEDETFGPSSGSATYGVDISELQDDFFGSLPSKK